MRDFLKRATKKDPSPRVVEGIADYMERNDLQMSSLRECITRAYFEHNATTTETEPPPDTLVLSHMKKYKVVGNNLTDKKNPLVG